MGYLALNVRIMNDGLGRMWYNLWIFLMRLRKTTKNLSKNSWPLGQNIKMWLSQYETEVQTT